MSLSLVGALGAVALLLCGCVVAWFLRPMYERQEIAEIRRRFQSPQRRVEAARWVGWEQAFRGSTIQKYEVSFQFWDGGARIALIGVERRLGWPPAFWRYEDGGRRVRLL